MKRREDITPIDIMIAVTIVGVLLAVFIPTFMDTQGKSDKHVIAWIELSENETIEVEVDHYTKSDDVLTIYGEDGTRYVVHASKVVIQEERGG